MISSSGVFMSFPQRLSDHHVYGFCFSLYCIFICVGSINWLLIPGLILMYEFDDLINTVEMIPVFCQRWSKVNPVDLSTALFRFLFIRK